MNTCPQCNQRIGPDQLSIGDWMPIDDERGITQTVVREIDLHCDFCGKFVAIQDHGNRIIECNPVTDPVELDRIAQLIPACRHSEIRRLTA